MGVMVDFKRTWFAPSEAHGESLRTVSGRRFRKGVQSVPEVLLPLLPKDAKVLGAKAPEIVPVSKAEAMAELRAADPERAAAEAMPEDEGPTKPEPEPEEDEVERKAREFREQMAAAKGGRKRG